MASGEAEAVGIKIVSLMLLGQTKLATQEGGFLAAFIDFSKAYERVCREKLWECLRGYSVSGKFLVMLQSLYLENSVEVKIGDKQRDHFPASTQARLCVVSSILLTVHQRLSCGVKTEEVWSRMWWSAHAWPNVCCLYFMVW